MFEIDGVGREKKVGEDRQSNEGEYPAQQLTAFDTPPYRAPTGEEQPSGGKTANAVEHGDRAQIPKARHQDPNDHRIEKGTSFRVLEAMAKQLLQRRIE